jgi:hypothetical protein
MFRNWSLPTSERLPTLGGRDARGPRATRSYAIALVFIAGGFVLGVTGWKLLGLKLSSQAYGFCSFYLRFTIYDLPLLWSCLALSVVLAALPSTVKKFVLLLSSL